MFDSLFRNTLAPLVLRLALAAIFIYHGFDKILNHDWGTEWLTDQAQQQSKPPDIVLDKLTGETREQVTVEWVRWMKKHQKLEPLPEGLNSAAVQIAVAWGELVGGIALLLGLLTRIAALGLILIQGGAIYYVTGEIGFAGEGGGYAFNVALIAMCLALVFLGGGGLSVDGKLRRKRKPA